jgi:hypothetical protein
MAGKCQSTAKLECPLAALRASEPQFVGVCTGLVSVQGPEVAERHISVIRG